jgi:two-component system sensor histidine kinase RegB
LFIAKTLLERTGAEFSFANGSDPYTSITDQAERRGAIVEVVWPFSQIVATPTSPGNPLGENRPIEY